MVFYMEHAYTHACDDKPTYRIVTKRVWRCRAMQFDMGSMWFPMCAMCVCMYVCESTSWLVCGFFSPIKDMQIRCRRRDRYAKKKTRTHIAESRSQEMDRRDLWGDAKSACHTYLWPCVAYNARTVSEVMWVCWCDCISYGGFRDARKYRKGAVHRFDILNASVFGNSVGNLCNVWFV